MEALPPESVLFAAPPASREALAAALAPATPAPAPAPLPLVFLNQRVFQLATCAFDCHAVQNSFASDASRFSFKALLPPVLASTARSPVAAAVNAGDGSEQEEEGE